MYVRSNAMGVSMYVCMLQCYGCMYVCSNAPILWVYVCMYAPILRVCVCIYIIESVKAEQVVVTRSLTLEGN
jgi:hypothetical protein